MTALAFLTAILAFTCFGLATDRHAEKRLGARLVRRHSDRLRFGGWALLALGFVVAMIAWGPVFGAIGWTATVLSGAAATFLALNLLPEGWSRRS